MKFFFLLVAVVVATAAAIILVGPLQHVAGKPSAASNKCALRTAETPDKLVCVCNATYCDNLVFDWPRNPGEGYLIQSSKSGLRFEVSPLESPEFDWCGRVDGQLLVQPGREYQSILGFGGAFTDAAGLHVTSMPKPLRQNVLESYYGEHGSQYNFARVPISGIDFSMRPYSYDDLPKGAKDYNLTHWSLAPEDLDYKIPLIKEALELVRTYNSSLKLFGSSWSPPAWMKENDSLIRGRLINSTQVYDSYAQYLIRFYNAYKSYGIDFWGGTLQNEARTAETYPQYAFNSLELGKEQAVEFLANYFGPALVANGYTKDKFKLMVGDDNLGAINDQVPYIMSHKEVHPYVAGLAFHWYNHYFMPYDKLTECVEQIKDHIEFVLMSEACKEPGKEKPVDLGSWDRGEEYASDIIEDLVRQSAGWVEWNMALDEQGGPNWASNWVDAAIIVNKDRTEFYKQPMYYALAHFSRFFRPGSIRVDATLDCAPGDKQVAAVAVHKKDTGHAVVNILNKSDQAKKLLVKVEDRSKVVRVQAKSIGTLVLKL